MGEAECDLERALEMFPGLTEIAIDVAGLISKTDISRLITFHDKLPLCPKLETIRLSNRSSRKAGSVSGNAKCSISARNVKDIFPSRI
jgi:hypothetical protein